MAGEFEQFGEYELHERIAIGGMAEVFRAMRRGAVGFEQELAIKRILPGLADDQFTAMFIDEAKIAVRLSHPNVAQVFDLGRVDEQLYIALEYVRGRDMRRVADRRADQTGRGALPPAIAVHVAMCVARALHAAHTTESLGRPLGIIHRDVSPQNVLLSFEGDVKVIDFGLAKAAGRLTRTQAGVVKGKLAYLSSEQARGEDIDHRSDIFSLGTCLFEWLTGERLFLGKNDLETVMSVQKANVPSLRSIDHSLPLRLETLVMKALEPDPFMRFETAQAMAEALERLAFEQAMIVTRGTLARFMAKLFTEDERAPAPSPGVAQASLAYELDDGDIELMLAPEAEQDAPFESPLQFQPQPPYEESPAGPPADFRPSALPAGFRPSALPGGPVAATTPQPEAQLEAAPDAESPWSDPVFEEPTLRHDTMPAPAPEDEPHDPVSAIASHVEAARPSLDDDDVTLPPSQALTDPVLELDDDTRVELELEETDAPTAQHNVHEFRPSLESTAPDDEWDEDEATRQLDLGDL